MRGLARTTLSAFFAACVLLVFVAQAKARLTRNEADLLAAVNGVRAQHGLVRFAIDWHLVGAARSHSLDMLEHGYFGHGPFAARMRRFGVRAQMLGENLAWGSGRLGSAGVIVQEWLASPDHRANLLRPGFRRIGLAAPVGQFAGLPGVHVVTADFAGR
jgi:uncharacterized protein YkwD